MVRLFFIRHGEREDHINLEWQNTAHRAHDSPLSLNGRLQAGLCAEQLEGKLPLNDEKAMKNIIFMSSPLVRCVMTTKTIMEGLGIEKKLPMIIEQGVSEANQYLRGRMMGTHLTSNKLNKLTGKPRGLTTPVLLGPGDLMALAHPVQIDHSHATIHQVEYSPHGYELLAGVDPGRQELLPYEQRVKVLIPKLFAWLEEKRKLTDGEELICVVVSHGALARNICEQIIGEVIEEKFGYVRTVELRSVSDPGEPLKFEIASDWNPGFAVVKAKKEGKNDDDNDNYA